MNKSRSCSVENPSTRSKCTYEAGRGDRGKLGDTVGEFDQDDERRRSPFLNVSLPTQARVNHPQPGQDAVPCDGKSGAFRASSEFANSIPKVFGQSRLKSVYLYPRLVQGFQRF